MSTDESGDPGGFGGFAPPPFDASAALVTLERSLRELGLAERGPGFELRGRRIVELSVQDGAIRARIARRPMLTPEWDTQLLRASPDLRKCVDEVKKRLARWDREE
jgi:hypothetical protein